ncbi:MAG TPA: hypothetical protein VFV11_02180 [Solimonas sp.]|nr:hypothetical protein [Solimonas sp.]
MKKWICLICGFVYDGEAPRFGAALNGSTGGVERPAIYGWAEVYREMSGHGRDRMSREVRL